ncbi:MAG: YihY/virulence factor BrkB family protein [Bryobacteraceae bacterium]|nr:YihY/virulence factor BrkB family protein [Bryobacteraceae bacterium]
MKLLAEVIKLFGRALWSAHADGCYAIAKAAAYSGLLSFFPVLTTLTAILVQANAKSVSSNLARFLFEVVPPGSEEFVLYVFSERGTRPVWLLVVATLLAIWAASGVMISLMDGFQAAYRVPNKRNFWRQRSVAIGLVFMVALPAIGASALVFFGESAERAALLTLGFDPAYMRHNGLRWLSGAVRLLIIFGTVVFVTTMLYRFGPSRPRSYRRLWPGAVVATLLWLGATTGFSWYVQNIGSYNLLYGSIGAVIALLVWLYLLAAIALVGCEFNAEGERDCRAGKPRLLFT